MIGWSVSQAFNECLRAILKLAPLLLVNPKPLEDESDDRWRWFKGCLGALDGTYIQIRVPSKDKSKLGVCDRNLNFTYVLPGWEGSAVDDRVLRNAIARTNGLKILEGEENCTGKMDSRKSSINPQKRSTSSTRRTWTPAEESFLIDGLKELCVNGWRADNGTFRPGHLWELGNYMRERHPVSGLKGEQHINSRLNAWKKIE
ncbi:hypothetical protein P3S67_014519 [Capsicum chacoense]